MIHPNLPEAVAQRVGVKLFPSLTTSEEGREIAAGIVRAVAEGRQPEVHAPTIDERTKILGLLRRELHGTRGAR